MTVATSNRVLVRDALSSWVNRSERAEPTKNLDVVRTVPSRHRCEWELPLLHFNSGRGSRAAGDGRQLEIDRFLGKRCRPSCSRSWRPSQ